MSVEVWDPFPSEREWVEFGRPRDVDSGGEVVEFSGGFDSGGVDFAAVLAWPEMPAAGWVGDALAQISLLSTS